MHLLLIGDKVARMNFLPGPALGGAARRAELVRPPTRSDAPLAERMRPRVPDDLVGQETVWAPGTPLRRLVEEDRFHALLFWGPPGTGKTSLARVIGEASGRALVQLSAVQHGVKDIREVLGRSAERLDSGQRSLVLFMDEIHRLSKSQQDVLLPALEEGLVKFIGATTENPSFEVNAAILSRTLVFGFKPLTRASLMVVMRRALAAMTPSPPALADDVLEALAAAADGDARRSLNLLDAVVAAAPKDAGRVELETIKDLAAAVGLRYDKKGDAHYDTISAFIKSIRASQPDAAVYYLARMLEAGEDPLFVARRLVIAASEDIGNANPTALLVAIAAHDAAHRVGMPEARIPLAQATTYLAASPKSNRAYVAINQALDDVRASGSLDVPLHLRNAVTGLMKSMGYGKGYVYAHDDQSRAQKLDYLPDALRGRVYYEPSEQGTEAQLRKHLEKIRGASDAKSGAPP